MRNWQYRAILVTVLLSLACVKRNAETQQGPLGTPASLSAERSSEVGWGGGSGDFLPDVSADACDGGQATSILLLCR